MRARRARPSRLERPPPAARRQRAQDRWQRAWCTRPTRCDHHRRPHRPPAHAIVGPHHSPHAAARQPLSVPPAIVRPGRTPAAVAPSVPTAETRPMVTSVSLGVRHTPSRTSLHRVAGVVRVHALRQTHRNRSNSGQARQVTTTQAPQPHTQQHVTAHAPAPSRQRQPTRSYHRPARHAVVAPHAPVVTPQQQRRVRQHTSITRPRQQPSAAHHGAARSRPQQVAARHAPVTKGLSINKLVKCSPRSSVDWAKNCTVYSLTGLRVRGRIRGTRCASRGPLTPFYTSTTRTYCISPLSRARPSPLPFR